MNDQHGLGRQVTDWLHAEATSDGADRVLAATLVQVSGTGQERARLRLPDAPRYAGAVLAASGAIAAVIAVAVAVVGINPSANTVGAPIRGVWSSNSDVAFTVALPPDAPENVFWRASMFDAWSGSARAWRLSSDRSTTLGAGGSILEVTDEVVAAPDQAEVTVEVTPGDDASGVVVAPGLPTSVDQAATVLSTGAGGSLARVELSRPGEPYTVTGIRPAPESVSVADLVAAGTDYPQEILSQYARPPEPGELGPTSWAFIDEIRAEVGLKPYGIAAQMVERFHSPEFSYDVDVRNVDCAGRGFTECFMWSKRGYCDYFATAMTLLLREQGIPARFIQGYLPGDRTGTVEVVLASAAHSWVEVYFPGVGWVPFDPTLAGRQTPLQ